MDPDDVPGDARVLDVRELDEPPFDPIVTALEELPPGATLLLVNGFEPEPLYDVLSARGFTHETEQVGPAEWHVAIRHASP